MRKSLLITLFIIGLIGNIYAQQQHFTVQGHERTDKNPTGRAVIKNVEDKSFTLDDIKFWVGEGENKAALVIDWYDDKGPTLVWGYRWNGEACGLDMINAIAEADTRMVFLTHYTGGMGNTIAGLGYDLNSNGGQYLVYDDGTTKETHYPVNGMVTTTAYNYDYWNINDPEDHWCSGWYNRGYWSYQVKDAQADDFSYSGMGASGRILVNGSWDGWGFQNGWESMTGTIPRAPYVAALPLLIDKESATINMGSTQQLSAFISLRSAEGKPVSWKSTDETIVTVNENGLVTAVAPGQANIEANVEGIEYTAVCAINVNVPVTGISLTTSEKSIGIGKTFQLIATVAPENASNKKVTWTSNNETVATIDEAGLITALALGQSTITATTEDGSFTATCDITVKEIPTFPPYESYWSEMGKDGFHQTIVDTRLARQKEELTEKWKVAISSSWMNGGQPLVVNGNIYLAINNKIMILDKETGNTIKENTLAGQCGYFSMIAYGEGKVFVPMSNGLLQAFNAETLESIWVTNKRSGNQQICPVVYSDGYVYTGTWKGGNPSSGVFYCVSAEDEDPFSTDEIKEPTWESDNSGFYWTGATVVNDFIYFGGDNGVMQARDRLTGDLIDQYELPHEGTNCTIRCGSTYDPATEMLYFTGKETESLYGIKINADGTFDKQNILSCKVSGQSTTVPQVYNGRVYVTSGTMTSGGGLDVIDSNTLEKIYTVNLAPGEDARFGISQSTPLITTAYATPENNNTIYIYVCLNESSGRIVCVKDFEGNTEPLVQYAWTPSSVQYCTHSLVAGDDGTIYYKNDQKYLFALQSNSPIDVTGITLNHEDATLEATTELQLTATMTPEDAANKNVTWSSSNDAVVTVDENGLVRAVAAGVAIISAETEDGKFTANCTITVTPFSGIDGVNADVIKVYPAITTGILNIIQPESNTGIQVIDLSGSIIKSETLTSEKSILDISSCPNGIYFLRIGQKTVRVIKQ